eukprot:81407-Pleurochrysis_carterae.AAC.1
MIAIKHFLVPAGSASGTAIGHCTVRAAVRFYTMQDVKCLMAWSRVVNLKTLEATSHHVVLVKGRILRQTSIQHCILGRELGQLPN